MKQDFFSSNNIKHVDYKDTDILKKFLGPTAKILSRRRTGLTAHNQRAVSLAVKRARFMGLIPYIAK
jgi:small subunit ribosomal protein S18